jgi:predicted YcjX-like family ATPase
MAIKTFKRRIGVTGLSNSGKTVFLTSLINHLKDHDLNKLPIGNGDTSISKFEPHVVGKGKNQFNFERYRDTLVNSGRWPEKTSDSSHFLCSFERSDWRFTGVEFELFDFPGERIADAAMVELKDFSTWSKYILNRLESETEYREHAKNFLEMQKDTNFNREELIHEYKLTLARLILAYKPLITPSTFLLGGSGDKATGHSPEMIAHDRYCGEHPEEQFVPLSETIQDADPKLKKIYSRRYKSYRENIVLPIFNYLKNCHRLVILVDVTTLLAAGTGMYSDNKEILMDLLHAVDPGTNFIRISKSLITKTLRINKAGGVTRIAFVASKADKVCPPDRDNMLSLLKQIIKKKADEINGLKADYFTCSAIISTQVIDDTDHMLAGHPISIDGQFVPPGGEIKKFQVSKLPEEWPLDWHTGEYLFPNIYPNVPKRRDCAPSQFGLERILDFIMDESFME